MIINRQTEAEIDKFFKESNVPTWLKGYRYLKDLVIYTLEHPEKNLKESIGYFCEKYGTSYEQIYSAIKTVTKKANIEERPNLLPREFIYMCISSLSYSALYRDKEESEEE